MKKIHPLIYAYIAYKSACGENALETKYIGDEPNADPRKWEMASKLLYKTKKPEMLRALIGKNLTKDFISFANQQVISVEDVIDHNYSDEDLEMKHSEKFATAAVLSTVDEERFEVARDFMKKLGSESRATFESLWAKDNRERLEYLEKLKKDDNLSQGEIKK